MAVASRVEVMRSSLVRAVSMVIAVLGSAAWLAGCGPAPASAQGGAAGGMPAPEVGVVTVAPQDVGLVTELPGRVESSRVAQVRARAAGILTRRLFREGSDVKAGQALFQIDDAPYQAAVQSAQAGLARAQAQLAQASARVERFRPLAQAQAISRQDYEDAQAAQALAKADVAVAQAALDAARINLGYTRVSAPISGRIGRSLVTEGALVGQGEATALAVIQQIDPVYVNFTQPASEVLRLRRAFASGQFKRAGNGEAVSVRLLLEDGTVHPDAGRLLFSDLSVDETTGQVTLRAQVPNPRADLLPGLYVRVQLEQAQIQNAILLPQQAVTRGSQGDSVMVVAPDGSFAPRGVRVGGAQGTNWIILEGLKQGEQVMVDGFMKLMPGVRTVRPVPWSPPGTGEAPGSRDARH